MYCLFTLWLEGGAVSRRVLEKVRGNKTPMNRTKETWIKVTKEPLSIVTIYYSISNTLYFQKLMSDFKKCFGLIQKC